VCEKVACAHTVPHTWQSLGLWKPESPTHMAVTGFTPFFLHGQLSHAQLRLPIESIKDHIYIYIYYRYYLPSQPPLHHVTTVLMMIQPEIVFRTCLIQRCLAVVSSITQAESYGFE
jgi:hypothetical protein